MLHSDCPRKIALILASLFVDTEADLVLLLTANGSIMAAQGYTERPDLPQIAQLINGTHASLQSLQIVGQDQASIVHIQQGIRERLACTAVNSNRVLAATFTRPIPAGLVRQRMHEARNDVNMLLSA